MSFSGATNGAMADPIAGLHSQPKTAANKSAMPALTESELDIPFYPGAVAAEPDGGPSSLPNGSGEAMVLLQTHDSADKVVAFYTAKLKTIDDDGKPEAPLRKDSILDGKPVVFLSHIIGHSLKAAEIRKTDDMTVIELMRMEASKPGSAPLPNNLPGATGGSLPDTPAGTGMGNEAPGASSSLPSGSDPTMTEPKLQDQGLKSP